MATETYAQHRPSTRDQQSDGRRLDLLNETFARSSALLPEAGPLSTFIYQNTLLAFEDLPFHVALKRGEQIYGCQPYLSEDEYREALARGRIRFPGLKGVLIKDLGDRAWEEIPCFGTRLELRLAMLQYPLRTGPTAELVWHVAEESALRRVRQETSSALRAQLISETRRWVMRDLRCATVPGANVAATGSRQPRVSGGLAELLDRSRVSVCETWSDEEWESFALKSLWRLCCDGVRDLPPFTPPPPPAVRHRDLLLAATGTDSDALVHDVMIRFCASFLDQGFASWELPGRDEGFYGAFLALYGASGASPDRWMRGLAKEVRRLAAGRVTPLESIAESLDVLGVAEGEWDGYLSATLVALLGWGSMIRQMERRPDMAVRPAPQGSLVGFLAARLLLERFALAFTAREALGYDGALDGLREAARARIVPGWPPSTEQRAFLVFQLAQVVGLSPDVLFRLDDAEWATLMREIEEFDGFERRRIFHLAYERHLTIQTLDAIALHSRGAGGRPASPRFQAAFCLDDREESFRRHLEELALDVETFGVAGVYNLAMYYRGAADAHFTPLCPVVVLPHHWVTEEVGDAFGESHRRRALSRRILGTMSHRFHVGSRSFALGAILSGGLGALASIPLVSRILFPSRSAWIRRRFGRFFQAPPVTRLRLERSEPTPSPENGGVGFELAEMVDAAERLIREMGLTSGFARLVFLFGHRSYSLNNPHNSAYHCGACGCAAGGPNARAMAQILNDPRARAILAGKGIDLPAETVFIGGYHNTSEDSVFFYDLDLLPESHRQELQSAREVFESTCARDAHERCRRFMSAPLNLSFAAAREHVEERTVDLAQTRPELGHATNSVTIVARRERTRDLFLDRRAFLMSYDPTQDDAEGTILARILGVVFPVCGGIALQYYFSRVDPTGFGAGTKLPYNVSALLGVMDGAASDLKIGLPWQGVEIHEPVRQLFVVETTTEMMLRMMERNEGISRLCRNGWVLLAVLDPELREIQVFEGGAFRPYRPQATVLPRAGSSFEWYRGCRENLEFAEIER